jgi:3-phytase
MRLTTSAAILALLATPALAADATEPLAIAVAARAETEGTRGDADDPAIWVNPADPARSLVLGTDKTAGLLVYDISGRRLAFHRDGRLNNVDVRPLDDGALAAATRRDDDTIVLYRIAADGALSRAEPFSVPAAPQGRTGLGDVYGFALGRDAASGRLFAFANFKSGYVFQWEITGDLTGGLELALVRTLKVATQPEGMVVDDAAGHLYIGEEDAGIWRFPLLPEAGNRATLVAPVPSPCLPRDDVEGLAVLDAPDGRFLVASAQGVHRIALFALPPEGPPACRALVEIAAGAIDGVTETDGLEATGLALGPDFPSGALVLMDDQNAGYTTNFKFVSWADIAAALSR